MIRDLRQSLRLFRKSPALTAAIVGTLALGIGATTGVFTVLDQVALRPLPVKEPDRLVVLEWNGSWRGSNTGFAAWSYPWYEDLRDKSEIFEELFCRRAIPVSFGYSGESDRITAEVVSGNYFRALGLTAARGRLHGPQDDVLPGGQPVAVLAHAFWRDRFKSSGDVVGRTIQLNGRAFDVIGVAPAGFDGLEFGSTAEVFVPAAMKLELSPGWMSMYGLEQRRNRWTHVFGRLKPGVSIAQASAALAPLFASLVEYDLGQPEMADASEYARQQYRQAKVDVLPGGQGVSLRQNAARTPLWILMAMVSTLLLIGCVNIANLMLARATARQKEIAVRLAVGAGRGRIVRQLMTENVLLAVAGGLFAVLAASWTASLLVWLIPDPEAAVQISTRPDLRVLGFAALLSLATALLFGLAPAFKAVGVRVAPTLKDQASAVAGGGFGLRRALVAVQVFFSLVLLIGAGLFWRTLENLRNTDSGLDTEHTIVFALDPPRNGYNTEQSRGLLRSLRERLGALPRAEGAGVSLVRPLSGDQWDSSVQAEGYEPTPGENMQVHFNAVSPGYFDTLGVAILEGRDFRESDVEGAPKVGIVNQKFVDYFFGGEHAVGRRFGIGNEPDIEIIGVIPDLRYEDMRSEIPRQMYLPYDQTPNTLEAHLYIRTAGDPRQLAGTIRQSVREFDAGVPIYNFETMSVQVENTLTLERMIATLGAAFGALATLLSAIGLYGVLAYSMARRTREIGLRMALGAQRRNILWLAMREVVWVFSIGAAVALPAAWALARLVQSQLHGVAPYDPWNMAAAAAILAAVSAAAGLAPAARAARVEPIAALRFE